VQHPYIVENLSRRCYGTLFLISRTVNSVVERRPKIFTGLITNLAPVISSEPSSGGKRLVIDCANLRSAVVGASVSINGVCLTVTSADGPRIAFDVVPETLSRSNLGELQAGDPVNVEPSLRLGDEVGGHFVYGHVDATTVVLGKHAEGMSFRMWCVTPPALEPMIAEKGYVALDGVSLTIAAIAEGQFAVALIPETLARTTLGRKDAGSALNLEADPIARYVVHNLRRSRVEP
jgi:riboflavin synthase